MKKLNKFIPVVWLLILVFGYCNLNADAILRAYVTNFTQSSVSIYNVNVSGDFEGDIQKIGVDVYAGNYSSQMAITHSGEQSYIIPQNDDRVFGLGLNKSGLFTLGSFFAFYMEYNVTAINFSPDDKFAYLLQKDGIDVTTPNSIHFTTRQFISLPFPTSIDFINYKGMDYAFVTSLPDKMTIFPIDFKTGLINPEPIATIATGNHPVAVKFDHVRQSIYVLCKGMTNNEIWAYRFFADDVHFEQKVEFKKIENAIPQIEIIPSNRLDKFKKTLLYVVNGPEITAYEDNEKTLKIRPIQRLTSVPSSSSFTAIAVNPIIETPLFVQTRYIYVTQSGANRLIGFKVTAKDGQYGVLSEQSIAPTGYNPSSVTLHMY